MTGAGAQIHGLPPDPNCLHCTLRPAIAEFMRQHADKPYTDAVAELLKCAAELLGSRADDVELVIAEAVLFLREEARESYRDFHGWRRA